MKYIIISALILFTANSLSFDEASKDIIVKSPDSEIELKMGLQDRSKLFYKVFFKNKLIVEDSELGIEFDKSGAFSEDIQIENVNYRTMNEIYKVPFGKSSEAHNQYNEAELLLKEQNGKGRKLKVIARVFDDGIAFRYSIPDKPHLKDFTITSELTQFKLPDKCKAHALIVGNNTHFEGIYKTYNCMDLIPSNIRYPLPILFEHPSGISIAISEAQLIDYAGMSLIKKNGDKNILTCSLTPWPEDSTIKVKGTAPHNTPWRVIMIGENPGVLIESNIIINLNDPCALTDISWIKPGKTTWAWWNGHVVNDQDFDGGMNYNTMKYYIDFAAENNIQYHSLTGQEKDTWYGRTQFGVHKTIDLNPMTPHEALNFDKLLKYAKDKNVGIRLWLNYDVLENYNIDEILNQFQQWGIKGFMLDFIQRDDQHAVNTCMEVLNKCAERHLEVNFHGASKPTGIQRTYPNLSNVEGVLNLEWDKWSYLCTPEHDLIVPFTRMLAGPMDYHLGGFRALSKDKFVKQDRKPFVMGTRCHHLAMYVIYENYLPMICDFPAAYENQAGFEFIIDVPVTWDETKVINARVGDYITIARRKGDNWYIGTMTDWSEREIDIPMTFLEKGYYQAVIYRDADDSDINPNNLLKDESIINNLNVIHTKMMPGGGNVIKISPIAKR